MEYIEELYGGNELENGVIEEEEEVEEDEMGETILRSEFKRALKDLNCRKAPGIDGIPVELLRSAGEEAIDRLYKLVCNIYEKGNFRQTSKKVL